MSNGAVELWKNELCSCSTDEEWSLSPQRAPGMTSRRMQNFCSISRAFVLLLARSDPQVKKLSVDMFIVLVGLVVTGNGLQTWMPSFLNFSAVPKDQFYRKVLSRVVGFWALLYWNLPVNMITVRPEVMHWRSICMWFLKCFSFKSM